MAEQMYCEGEQVHQRDVSTTDECAIQCDGLASMFVVGTNDYGTSSQCKNGKCKCICQPNAANDGTCDQKSDSRFRLFKFQNDGNLLENHTCAILVNLYVLLNMQVLFALLYLNRSIGIASNAVRLLRTLSCRIHFTRILQNRSNRKL